METKKQTKYRESPTGTKTARGFCEAKMRGGGKPVRGRDNFRSAKGGRNGRRIGFMVGPGVFRDVS